MNQLLDKLGDTKAGYVSKIDEIKAQIEILKAKEKIAIEYIEQLNKETNELLELHEELRVLKTRAVNDEEDINEEVIETIEVQEAEIESALLDKITTRKQLASIVSDIKVQKELYNQKLKELYENYNRTMDEIKDKLYKLLE